MKGFTFTLYTYPRVKTIKFKEFSEFIVAHKNKGFVSLDYVTVRYSPKQVHVMDLVKVSGLMELYASKVSGYVTMSVDE